MKDRLKFEGYNELPATKPRSIFTIAIDADREPMFLLLVAGGMSGNLPPQQHDFKFHFLDLIGLEDP